MICKPCAERLGGEPNFTVATFNILECGHCGKETSVTQERNYKFPKDDEK